ncbi:PRA1 family protein 3 [Aethina tumida]|uniref:PRA1 family protein 3 n=1 Tax=Aethina tumida TaxID=116153 RepID=UPI00096B12C2|nr:PRA1 family protein 3 [Aethina tumida]
MNKTKKTSSYNYEIPPLRPLDDFLLDSARFQVPNVNDLEKWGNRVSNNLLYYQTNYFLLALVIFIIVGVIHPVKMTCGFLAMAIILMMFIYVTNEKRAALEFKQKHPIVSLILVLAGGYFVSYMLKSLLVFLLGIFLPFTVTFLHSSLRLRNLKNKITNKVESVGLMRTPMGIFLAQMGFQTELF